MGSASGIERVGVYKGPCTHSLNLSINLDEQAHVEHSARILLLGVGQPDCDYHTPDLDALLAKVGQQSLRHWGPVS